MDKNALRAVVITLLVLSLVSAFVYFQFAVRKPKVELVLGFPSTPVYQNAELLKSEKDPREDIVWDAKWVSESDVPTVAKWYLEKLQSEGWILDIPPADANASDIQFASLIKDNFYVLHISFVKNQSGKTEIITEFLRWMDSEKEGKFVNGEFIEEEEEE